MSGFWQAGFWATGFWSKGFWGDQEQVVSYSGGEELDRRHPWLRVPTLYEIAEIDPGLADAVIDAVARVADKRKVRDKDVETEQAAQALRARLAAQQQAWKQTYLELIRLEYERREQEYEDAQIAMLLFEM